MIFLNDNDEPHFKRGTRIYPRNPENKFMNLCFLKPYIDPITYELSFV